MKNPSKKMKNSNDMTEATLVLGTAQLGMPYGLNNTRGMPSEDEAFAILDVAHAGGIGVLDTAYAYGTAEDVVGKWLGSRKLGGKVRVISKMKPHVLKDYPDGARAADIVREEVAKSLQRLGLESLDAYLLHSPHYIYISHVVDGLRKIKEEGLVENIGVSIYDETEALHAVEIGMDYVQIPYNVLDRRLHDTDFFKLARKKKVTVFARSPFLQGLLLMEPERIPPHLSHARSLVERFQEIVARHNLSPAEAALIFARTRSRADYVVFGVESLSQLEEDIRSGSMKDDALARELEENFQDTSRGIVNPSLWSKAKR
ncbi:MAG: aldo/keto reductase [Patescibacteria group bacterium]|nr:aldo/keto reductase [Patescibacteria group bacterium]